MAATPPGPRKRRMEPYNMDQPTYDEFVKLCSRKGFAPQIILEQFMRKYVKTGGQI